MIESLKSNYLIRKTRVFSFTDRTSPECLCGGPGGVNYRLMTANRNYHYFENFIAVFKDCIYDNDKKWKLENEKYDIEDYYLSLNEVYQFTEDDIYFFHDSSSEIIFLYLFPYNKKSILVYHQQGTLAKEYEYFAGSIDDEIRDNYNNLFELSIKNAEIAAFPSWGAVESVISSDVDYKELIEKKRKAILYNGCDIENLQEDTNNIIGRDDLEEIERFDGFKFISAAALNDAKGVEQIPQYLYEIKKKYGRIKWIIIGDGLNADKLMGNIIKYNLMEDVIWSRKKLEHQTLMKFLHKADFYIMAHRISIFDFAIIEAMSCECIPILTDIGGNKDFIFDKNGIFIKHDNLADITMFTDMIKKFSIHELKEKNKKIAEKKFSQKAFLKGYADLTLQLISEHKHI